MPNQPPRSLPGRFPSRRNPPNRGVAKPSLDTRVSLEKHRGVVAFPTKGRRRRRTRRGGLGGPKADRQKSPMCSNYEVLGPMNSSCGCARSQRLAAFAQKTIGPVSAIPPQNLRSLIGPQGPAYPVRKATYRVESPPCDPAPCECACGGEKLHEAHASATRLPRRSPQRTTSRASCWIRSSPVRTRCSASSASKSFQSIPR